MSRAVILISLMNALLGFISLGVGIAWIVLYFYDDKFGDERLPYYAYLVMLPEIVCGFLIFLGACFGFCLKRKTSCAGLLFVTAHVFNVIVWTPTLVTGNSFLIMIMASPNGTQAICGLDPCLPAEWDTYNLQYLVSDDTMWVYAFPGVGLAVGFLVFFFSIGTLCLYCSLSNNKNKAEINK